MTIEEQSVLAPVIERLVERFDPRRIILFGSRARGQAKPGSDYDLLVIEDGMTEPTAAVDRVGEFHVDLVDLDAPPVDVLLYTQAEFDYWRVGRNNVVARAAREGQVVYERP